MSEFQLRSADAEERQKAAQKRSAGKCGALFFGIDMIAWEPDGRGRTNHVRRSIVAYRRLSDEGNYRKDSE